MVGQECSQGVRTEQGYIADEHHQSAFKAIESTLGLQNSVACPQLLELIHKSDFIFMQGFSHALSLMTHDHDGGIGIQAGSGIQEVLDDGCADEGVKNLGKIRMHSPMHSSANGSSDTTSQISTCTK